MAGRVPCRWPLSRSAWARRALCFAAILCAGSARSQTPRETEGPLQNDASLSSERELEEWLARGDSRAAELERARRAALAPDQTLSGAVLPEDWVSEWAAVFDAWQAALERAPAGAAVTLEPQGSSAGEPWSWVDQERGVEQGSLRRTEGIEVALLRRLAALDPRLRRAWEERFSDAAASELARSRGSAEGLRKLESSLPGTRAALLAALRLAEAALERGHDEAARTHLARARQHERLLEAPPQALSQALALREAWLASRVAARSAPAQSWGRAQRLSFAREIPLVEAEERRRAQRPLVGRATQSGLAWLDDGRALVQSTQTQLEREQLRGEDYLTLIDPRTARPLWSAAAKQLLAERGVELAPALVPREHPGWPHRPHGDGQRVVVVLCSRPSALLCLEFPAPAPAGPRLAWAWIASTGEENLTWIDRNGDRRALDPAYSRGSVRFEPGPILCGGALLLQTRAAEEQGPSGPAPSGVLRGALLAVDPSSGAPLWRRTLARGQDVAREGTRFSGVATSQSAGQPLVAFEGRALVNTHLGAAALFDACDGRLLWAFKPRRRLGEERGLAGTRSAAAGGPATAVLLAGADSDRIYFLRTDADMGLPRLGLEPPRLAGLFVAPPLSIGECEELLGGDGRVALCLSRAAASHAVVQWNPRTRGRLESVHLGPGESFTGAGLLSDERVLAATQRGLYLLDRTRELFLLDFAAAPDETAPASSLPFGGDLFARGEHVLVVGPHAAWVFRASGP